MVAAVPFRDGRDFVSLSGTGRLAFAGGFFVAKPACVPLRVKVADAYRTVHIAIGKRCPS
jgi:hypothetical protein